MDREESTIVVFFSITGGVGKSFLASHLFRCWENDGHPARCILVDADLVWAALSRWVLTTTIVQPFHDDHLRKACTTTAELMDAPVHLDFDSPATVPDGGNPRLFIPAAPWVCDLAHLPPFIPESAAFDAQLRRVEIERGLPRKMELAQRAQVRLQYDLNAQQRLWGNLLQAALAAPSVIIVDLPAQGPAGVSLQAYWDMILHDARHAARRAKCVPCLRLVRVLVYADETVDGTDDGIDDERGRKQTPHPLVKQFIEGVNARMSGYQDVVICQNFSRNAEPEANRRISLPAYGEGYAPSAIGSLIDTIDDVFQLSKKLNETNAMSKAHVDALRELISKVASKGPDAEMRMLQDTIQKIEPLKT